MEPLMELGEFSYTAYGFKRNWLTYDNKPMPAWGDLIPEIQEAWAHVEQANAEKFTTKVTLTEREFRECNLSNVYVSQFDHGTNGHLSYTVINKLFTAIMAAQGAVTIEMKPPTRSVIPV